MTVSEILDLLSPQLVLLVTGLLVLALDLILDEDRKGWLPPVAISGESVLRILTTHEYCVINVNRHRLFSLVDISPSGAGGSLFVVRFPLPSWLGGEAGNGRDVRLPYVRERGARQSRRRPHRLVCTGNGHGDMVWA